MCGIFGLVANRAIELDLPAVLGSLRHRGPDGSGTWIGSAAGRHCTLAHARLAIIDLTEGGHQPKTSRNGRYVVTFNGEIYNHRDLRTTLESLGHRFETTSDTEVLLSAYAEWGAACLERLRGMFAFGVWDTRLGRLFLARDRFGIKPLYVARTPEGLAFASELRTLLAAGVVERRLSDEAVCAYLSWGSVPDPLTIIEGIESLVPGTYLTFDGEGYRATTYWEPHAERSSAHTFEEAVERVRPVLRSAVQSHLVSDVPVGVFLSGGIDSSAITALMKELGTEAIHTFSVGLDDDGVGESTHAATVAAALGTEHHALPLVGTAVRDQLDDALDALDQPSADGINTYFIARAVRETGLKVVLSGLGGDELFAGYAHFRAFGRMRELAGLVPPSLLPTLEGALSALGGPLGGRRAKLAALLTAPRGVGATYAVVRSMFTPSQAQTLLSEPSMTCAPTAAVPRYLADKPRSQLDPVNLFSVLELTNYLRNTLLRDSDCMSMANGLEVRVPFLDHLLIAEVLSIPGRLKLARDVNKPLLVAASPPLPHSAVYRKKMGFELPFDAWMRGPFREKVAASLLSPSLARTLGLAPSTLERAWQRFLNGSPELSASRIWCLAALTFWCERNRVAHA